MRYILFTLSLLGLLYPAHAQTVRSSIAGTVTTESGSAIDGANVSLLHRETGRERSAVSTSSGAFIIPLLAPGTYRLEVSADGHRTSERELTLLTGQELHIDVPLLSGQRSERIVVTASVPR